MVTKDLSGRPELNDVLELAELLRPAWADISASIPSWHPRNEGDDEAGDTGTADAAAAGAAAGAAGAAAADAAGSDAAAAKEPDWKRESRKHEARAKQAARELAETQTKLKEREEADQSDQEKALAKAREEGKAEALTAAQQERRKDRLEVAVTRLAAKTFADTEDAILHVERAIAAEEIAAEDIFNDEGKVQTDALTTALTELLERKPHLKAGPNGLTAGDADAGKGSGPTDDENLGVEGHLKKIQGR